ncbi:MAG TPA: hypothetical protein VFU13_04090 [Steroidobacteraceae bacterium]|nr:hypothetical protein [Steroidobacteraceae bacterium]
MDSVASWSFEQRLGETFRRTVPKLGPEAAGQLSALINPTSLGIIAGVLVAWIVSHAFGVGEVIDIIILVVGVASIGFAIFSGLDYLYDFAVGAYQAKTSQDLDRAAENLAKAITILGIQAVLAVLFRGARAPRTGAGGRMSPGPAPPRTPGLRYKPTITHNPNLPAGTGSTSFWGNIKVSTQGSATDRALVLLHEKVHQFLAPKLYVLREYRASNRVSSYWRSSLWRYIEEALAETVAQVGVNGFRNFFTGIRFPVQQGYMYLTKGGGYNPTFQGSGFIPEGAALLYNAVVGGIAFELWFEPSNTSKP